MRGREQGFVLGAAEIGAFEQFGRQDDLGALGGRFAHQFGHVGDILRRSSPKASWSAATLILLIAAPAG